MEVYTRVFALELAGTLPVPFTGDGPNAPAVLRSVLRSLESAYQTKYCRPTCTPEKLPRNCVADHVV